MIQRERFIRSVLGECIDSISVGTVTSIANIEAMNLSGASFPEAHLDSEKMVQLSSFVSIEADFDMIFPVFSVVQEAAALGSDINWGRKDVMPTVKKPLWNKYDDIRIPDDFENKLGMFVVLDALGMLKKRYGNRYAVVGKVFGPWSLSYHMFGIDNILIMTIDNPEELKRILRKLSEVTVRSAIAQIKAGADVLCLADHCSHDMVSAKTYKEFLFPLHKAISGRVHCPLVLHTCGETSDRIHLFADTGFSCFHYDTCVPAKKTVELSNGKISLMGGISNIFSLLNGDEKRIMSDVKSALSAGINVIGPECALPLNTKMQSLKLIRKSVNIFKNTK